MGTNPVFASPNRLKLGLFCTNTVPALTLAPELFTPTWENCLAVARKADGLAHELAVAAHDFSRPMVASIWPCCSSVGRKIVFSFGRPSGARLIGR